MTNDEILEMIASRIKYYRVYAGMTQDELAARSGLSKRSISRIEQGSSIQLDSLIRILAALNLQDNLSLLIPDQTIRPSAYLPENASHKQRVRKKPAINRNFKWGDEK